MCVSDRTHAFMLSSVSMFQMCVPDLGVYGAVLVQVQIEDSCTAEAAVASPREPVLVL